MTGPEALPARVRRAALASLGAYYALLLLLTAFTVRDWLAGAPVAAAVFLLLLRTGPLLIFARGLHQRRPRTAAWLSFVILMYFVHAVTTAFVAETRVWGLVYSLLCMAQFTALVVFINLGRKSGLSLQPESDS